MANVVTFCVLAWATMAVRPVELWSQPGWYAGGYPFDPLPLLTAWAGWS